MNKNNDQTRNELIIGSEQDVTIEDVIDVAEGHRTVRLNGDEDYRRRLRNSAEQLAEKWRNEEEIYGVTTGFGESCETAVSGELIEDLPRNLTRFHGCGLGDHLDETSARAVLLVRLASLSHPASAVRPVVLERLATLLNKDIIPMIPEEGSVGASGDLTPLSYIAGVLLGERDVMKNGEVVPTDQAYEEAGLDSLDLRPKEALSIMNGTSVMSGLACLAFTRTRYLTQLCTRLTAMTVVALDGNERHYDKRIFDRKDHPGQSRVARRLREDLSFQETDSDADGRLQERYSLRCAPHIIGVPEDMFSWAREQIETEINSSNDNPLLDPETGDVLHGGNFYGGHISFVMDSMKNAVAQLSDLLDRQLEHLVDPKVNRHLPANLSGATDERRPVNHGFKAVQIGTSAWAAEALNNTAPTGPFSRSTESHNQDKVSMGTIAARDCLRIIELTEQVSAANLLAVSQGLDCRSRDTAFSIEDCESPIRHTYRSVREVSPFVEEDRPLESELRRLVERVRSRSFELY